MNSPSKNTTVCYNIAKALLGRCCKLSYFLTIINRLVLLLQGFFSC